MDRLISLNEVLKMQYIIDDSATLSTRDVVNVDDIKALPSAEPYKGMTNEEVIKAVFGFKPRKNTCIIPKLFCNGNPAECDGCKYNDWWNSPYEPQERCTDADSD